MIFRHYGDKKFNIDKFKPIRNKYFFPKPHGGLWACPVDSNHSWKQWCEGNNFNIEHLKDYFNFTLKDNARILVIDSPDDMKEKFIFQKPKKEYDPVELMSKWNIDFLAMSKIYDVIYLTEKGEVTTRFHSNYNLYGWDCESILILNKNIIKL